MSIQRIQPGVRLSKAVVHGNLVYLAGQVADKTAGKSVAEQTAEILDIIDALLAEAGTDKSKVLTVNIWLTDITKWAEMNSVWEKWVVPGQTPARATVQAVLASPANNVEIMLTAAK